MADRRDGNMVQLVVALAVLVVTLVLTYTTEYFSFFHGAWLAILSWFLLAAAVLTALAVKSRPTSRLIIARNVTFGLGVFTMASSIGLVIWANNMFSAWPKG